VAFYNAQIHKAIGDVRDNWCNTYHVSAADEDDALSIMEDVAAMEKAIHWSDVFFTRIAVRQDSPLAGSGRQLALTGTGDRDATGEQFLPSFCTVRIVLTDGVNRPDQRYFRLRINENENESGLLSSTLITFLEVNFIATFIALSGVVSSSHVPYTGGTVVPQVQNRQRGWHRRTRPGFKRGWVPV